MFSIFNLVFSFTALDEKRTMFSLEGFSDRKFLLTTGMQISFPRASNVARAYRRPASAGSGWR